MFSASPCSTCPTSSSGTRFWCLRSTISAVGGRPRFATSARRPTGARPAQAARSALEGWSLRRESTSPRLRMNTTGCGKPRTVREDARRTGMSGGDRIVAAPPARATRIQPGSGSTAFLAVSDSVGGQPQPLQWRGLGRGRRRSAPGPAVCGARQKGLARYVSPPGRPGASSATGGPFLTDSVTSGGGLAGSRASRRGAAGHSRPVRLVSGSGDNPAVPGEDFVDDPVETTISKGARTARVFVQLLRNEGMQGNRSLGATVSVIPS